MSDGRKAEKHADLIYDVGMHKGEDTDYYLRKGFRVVGFEADPDLATQCRARFADEIQNKRLVLVEGAITEESLSGGTNATTRFYKNRGNTVWGTVSGKWARRNAGLGASSDVIEVPVIRFPEALETYGIPHYLKIDIEGMDTVCLKSLLRCDEKPDYVSIESDKLDFNRLVGEIELLTELGYLGFKAIQQQGISRQREPAQSTEGRYAGYRFQEGSSGLFGEDLPGDWSSHRQILERYRRIFVQYRLFGDRSRLRRYRAGRTLISALSGIAGTPMPGWYDTHAKHSSAAS